MEAPPDEVLLQCIALGDQIAFGLLYDRYGKPAYSLAYRVVKDGAEAEDVVQEAFLNVWRMANSFDRYRGSARSWLLSIVHHKAIDTCRRRRGQPARELSLEFGRFLEGTQDIWQEVVNNLDREAIQKALAKLPQEQQQAIELAYFAGYTQQEIAELLQIPLGTVKGRIRIGMEKLRHLLQDQEGEV
jgi:RNA polymerase sigma-70 factor (ECF subfamily)